MQQNEFNQLMNRMDRWEEKHDEHVRESRNVHTDLATLKAEMRLFKWIGGGLGVGVISLGVELVIRLT